MTTSSPPRTPGRPKNANPNGYNGRTQILLGIVGACLALAILSWLPTENSNSPNRDDHNRDNDSDDDRFLISHTLDPSIDIDRNYLLWGHEEWMAWMNRRENALLRYRARSKTNGKRLNQKSINTVVIASPQQISDIFAGDLLAYGDECVWSNNRLPTYLFLISNGGRITVFLCPPTYIAVILVNRKPVHLGATDFTRVSKENSNFSHKKNCTLIPSL